MVSKRLLCTYVQNDPERSKEYEDMYHIHIHINIYSIYSIKRLTKHRPLQSFMSSSKKKTVLDMIIVAIRSQPQNANGVSRTMIAKYLKSEFQYDKVVPLKNALKKAVEQKKLIQNGQSFRVAGDDIPEVAQEPQIEIKELIEGSNEKSAAQDGDTVVVKYQGKLEDGTVFDEAASFEFTLGAGEVIKGWDLGVKGMRIGGKRKLYVPSKLGYGKRGAMPEIPPNADLYFKITLKEIK